MQSAPDIKRKSQKFEAGPQTPLSILVEEVFEVYNNWDQPEEAKMDKRLEKDSALGCFNSTAASG